MNDVDMMLIAEFLQENYSLFKEFLSFKNIDESEADAIIDQLEDNRV